jgi:hypothetical protein
MTEEKSNKTGVDLIIGSAPSVGSPLEGFEEEVLD